MAPVVTVNGLVKSFGSFRALDGLDLSVEAGEVHGFLGPNGSGKTTTIRVLLGLLRADEGQVRLLGGDPWRDAVALHRRLAYVPGDVSLWPKLTGGEVIDLFARLRGDLDPHRRDELVRRFELDPTKRSRTYSKGNRQKVALIAALASSADLLILDEPTSGLDPLMEAVFQASIQEVRQEGRTVLLSSHILAEVEALCDRVSIIRAGRTVESGTLDSLRQLTRTAVTAETERPPVGLESVPGVHALHVEEGRVRFDVDTVHLGAAVRCLSDAGVRTLVSNPPTLEELFLRHYGDELADDLGTDDEAARGVSALQGTAPLAHLVVARDKIRLLAWIAGIVLLVYVTAVSTAGIYPTQADLDEAARASRDNPAALAFNGPDQGLDTLGGQVAFQVGAFGLVMVGLMSLLLTSRFTRGEEDSGRLELVRAMPVGRHAPLAAALVVISGALALLGALVTASLLLQDLPVAGSLVFGASFTAFGLAFAATTAVTAQVTENPRVASGIAGALLGASFALRAAGDVGDGALSWLSPMGWAQKARPFAGEHWWPLLLCVALAAGLTWMAVALAAHRDFGAGLVPPRPGPPVAADWLGSPVGLAARLHRGAAVWWTIAVLALGLTYGALADSIDDFVGDNQSLQDVLAATGAASLTDSYLATSLLVIALLAAGPAIQIVLRLRAEETGMHTEPVLATPTSRTAWAGSHLGAALAGSAMALLAGGLGLGLSYALVGGDWTQVPRLLGASIAYLPAVWLLAALTLALYGLAPRWTTAAWIALVACIVIGMFGTLLDLPTWVSGLSPFQRTPAVPADPFELLPVVALAAATVGLTAVGLTAFRSRDLVTS